MTAPFGPRLCYRNDSTSADTIDAKGQTDSVKHTVQVFRENVLSLLQARNEDASSLAFWCKHDKSWMSKILTGERVVKLTDIDKIADFFGLSPYQLFQPGISLMTERRIGERRSGNDRRHAQHHPEDAQMVQSFRRRRPPNEPPDQRVRLLGSGEKDDHKKTKGGVSRK